MEENLEYYRELIPDAPAWVHDQLAHERVDLEAAIKKAEDEANTWANKWAEDRNKLTEYKQLAESQRGLFKKMEAEADAKDALIGELRDMLAEADTVLSQHYGEGYPERKRIASLLARTPADAGAELARLRQENATMLEASQERMANDLITIIKLQDERDALRARNEQILHDWAAERDVFVSRVADLRALAQTQ